jgi:hypothetical protein
MKIVPIAKNIIAWGSMASDVAIVVVLFVFVVIFIVVLVFFDLLVSKSSDNDADTCAGYVRVLVGRGGLLGLGSRIFGLRVLLVGFFVHSSLRSNRLVDDPLINACARHPVGEHH